MSSYLKKITERVFGTREDTSPPPGLSSLPIPERHHHRFNEMLAPGGSQQGSEGQSGGQGQEGQSGQPGMSPEEIAAAELRRISRGHANRTKAAYIRARKHKPSA